MIHIFFILFFTSTTFTCTSALELKPENSNTSSIYIENKKNVTFERLRELTIIKAAKMAQSLGYTHFEFMYSADKPVTGSVERQGNIVKDVYGNASQANTDTTLFPTPIREKGMVIVKFCNDSETSCRGISAREALKDLHP
jgi:hypothetical protein